VNKTVNRVNAATENLPDLLQTMTSLASALGNAIIYLNYWFIALVCLIALWKVNGKLAKYLAAIGGMCSNLLFCALYLTLYHRNRVVSLPGRPPIIRQSAQRRGHQHRGSSAQESKSGHLAPPGVRARMPTIILHTAAYAPDVPLRLCG
jgi:hypothetical protein